jgi:hypothetical protein
VAQAIRRELLALEKAYGSRNPLFTGVMLSLPGLSILVPLAARSPGSLPLLAWLAIGLAWIACCALAGWWQRRRLDTGLQAVQARIAGSGIIERLAIGPETLPDIYRYAALLWQPFLGPPPTKLAHWLKLVAANLDWYLAEPRPWFRPVWLANAGVVLPYLLAIILILNRHQLNLLFGAAPPQAVMDPAWLVAILLMLSSVTLALWVGYDYARQGLVARALRLEIEQRLLD